jgi:hypothetical protein
LDGRDGLGPVCRVRFASGCVGGSDVLVMNCREMRSDLI